MVPSTREPDPSPAPAPRPPVDRCAVIVPAYNESGIIKQVVADIRSVFPHVIVVDDGSADGTSAQAQQAGAIVMRHCVNVGQGGALETGIRYAHTRGYEYFVTMDADGQHQVADALAMLGHLHRKRGELDIVLGSRFLPIWSSEGVSEPGRGGSAKTASAPTRVARSTEIGRRKRLLLWGATLLSRQLHGLALTDTHNGLRVFSRRVAEKMRFAHVDMAHASDVYDIIRKYDFRFEELPVVIRYTDYSKAKGQPMLNAINILVDFLFNRVK
jgi:glycosyltransferase involved in cell wall biosynthesis